MILNVILFLFFNYRIKEDLIFLIELENSIFIIVKVNILFYIYIIVIFLVLFLFRDLLEISWIGIIIFFRLNFIYICFFIEYLYSK